MCAAGRVLAHDHSDVGSGPTVRLKVVLLFFKPREISFLYLKKYLGGIA